MIKKCIFNNLGFDVSFLRGNSNIIVCYLKEILKKGGVSKKGADFGLVSLFNGISTFVGYLMPKPFS